MHVKPNSSCKIQIWYDLEYLNHLSHSPKFNLVLPLYGGSGEMQNPNMIKY